jgi:hypothetical protein
MRNLKTASSTGQEGLIVCDDEIGLFPLDFFLKFPDKGRGLI